MNAAHHPADGQNHSVRSACQSGQAKSVCGQFRKEMGFIMTQHLRPQIPFCPRSVTWRKGCRAACGLAAAVLAAVLAGILLMFPAAATERTSGVRSIIGDPYDLAGNRIVFTNWHYVRPGIYAWKDADGRNVTAVRRRLPDEDSVRFSATDIPRGIRLSVQQPVRTGPIDLPEGPWDDHRITGRTLLRDGSVFRLWAQVTMSDGSLMPCLFESPDGQKWSAPRLGLVRWNGSKDNNFLPTAPRHVFIDPSAPDTERYKGVSIAHDLSRAAFEEWKKQHPNAWEHRADRGETIFAVRGFVSPDGLRWNRLPEPLVVEHSDTDIIAEYDSRSRKYVLYTRHYDAGPQSTQVPPDPSLRSWLGDFGGAGRRSIGRSESDRFDRFPLSDLLMIPGPRMLPSEVFYTNCKTSIPGAPDQHLMFPAVWDIATDTTRIVMVSSPDGRVWNDIPGGTVLTTASFGQWDGGCVFAFPHLTELPDGSFVLPYRGYSVPHKFPRGQWTWHIGLAVWPQGRIVALEAPDFGEFATVRIMPPGRHLRINAVTKRAGSILVEAADAQGRPLPGRTFQDAVPIRGDHYRTTVRWNEADDLGFREGEPIILRFRMRHARLFSLDFD